MSELTLREVCKIVGVTRRAIQGYEKIGMVQSTGKNKYGYLLYDDVAVNKIRTIKKYRDMGFSVKEVKEYLESKEDKQQEMIKARIRCMKLEIVRLKEQIDLAEKLLQ